MTSFLIYMARGGISGQERKLDCWVRTISKESRPEEMGLHINNEWARECGVDTYMIKSGPSELAESQKGQTPNGRNLRLWRQPYVRFMFKALCCIYVTTKLYS